LLSLSLYIYISLSLLSLSLLFLSRARAARGFEEDARVETQELREEEEHEAQVLRHTSSIHDRGTRWFRG